ncbi:MAG TPA: hypothetical protein PLU75_08185 [Oscillospiraceae bacterium]|nr:hypothetical protein [Oscillospiraceae bacterium]HRW56221.1 hypothetical protein [Oscillospiraceae bacterium]
MSGMEDIYVGLISFLPAILIFVAVAAIAAKRLKQRDDTSGKKPAQAGGVQSYTPKGYSREVKEIHQTDPEENYRRRMEQLRALFQNGMMERDEFEDRKAEIEEDYRQGIRTR